MTPEHINNVIIKARKGLAALKTMAAAFMHQRLLLLLYHSLILSVVEYGLGLLTISSTQLNRLETIQDEAMRVILGCTRPTSTAAMRFVLDLSSMGQRHKLAQVKAMLRVTSDTEHPLHPSLNVPRTSRLKRGTSWMAQAQKNCVSMLLS